MRSNHPPILGKGAVLVFLLGLACLFPIQTFGAGKADSRIQLLSSDARGVTLEVTIDAFQSQETLVDGTPYQRLSLSRSSTTTALGEPELPVLGQFIAVPANSRVSYEILDDDRSLLPGYRIYPAQEPPKDQTGSVTPAFRLQSEAYQRDQNYPSQPVEISEIQTIRDLHVVRLSIHPLQYRASRGELTHHRRLQIRLHFNAPQGMEGFSELPATEKEESFQAIYDNLILNYDDVSRYPSPASKQEIIIPILFTGAEFLIITDPAFADAAQKLAEWKIKRGISTAVRSTAITGTTAAGIKSYIQTAYTGWGTRPSYILFLGDVNHIPTNYITTHPAAGDDYPTGHKIGTDLYYATMGGASDRLPDIHLGRMPVDTVTEANHVVDKVIEYETNPTTSSDFYSRILMAAYFQDRINNATEAYVPDKIEDRLFTRTSEDIRDYLLTRGYTLPRIYNTEAAKDPRWYNDGTAIPAALRKPGFPWTGSRTDITNGINDGAFALFFRGHGSSGGWGEPNYHVDDIADWNNGKMTPVVFSTTCESGWFDAETDGYSSSTRDPSFAERLLRFGSSGQKGAAGVFAATRISYSWHNDSLIKGFVDSIWPTFLTYAGSNPSSSRRMGSVLSYGKYYYASVWGTTDSYAKSTLELYHYLGDPTMRMWTDEPRTLTVSHASTATYGASSFTVTVDQPLSKITITQNNNILGSEYSSIFGPSSRDVDLSPAFGANEAWVTVTSENFKPYIGRVILRPSTPTDLDSWAHSKTGIWIAWEDHSNSEQGFRIERSLNGTGGWAQIATNGANDESYVNGGLTCGTDYYYRVLAYNTAGNSPYSNVHKASTLDCTSTAPTSLQLSNITQTAITLAWGDAGDNETGFKIERSLDGTSFTQITTVGANITTYTNTTLVCNTKYYYRVRSYNTGGNSSYSNTASATTLACTPGAPTDLTATGLSQIHIRLDWKDNSNNETGFEIWTHPGGIGLWTKADTVGPNITTYTDLLRGCNSSLTYRIRAVNDGGDSVYSNTAVGTTKPCVPNAPARLEGRAISKTEAYLRWIDNSKDETGFKIEVQVGRDWATAATTRPDDTDWTISKLLCNTTYIYRVSACNALGCSDPTNTVKITTFDCNLEAPNELKVASVSSTQINLAWTDATTGETGFKVERSLDGTSDWKQVGTTGANIKVYADPNLNSGTMYYYRVCAYQSLVNSPYSNVVRAKTVTSTQSVLEFPQIAVGDIWRSFLFLTNPTDSLIRGTVEFFKPDGTPLTINVSGVNVSSRIFIIAKDASLKLDLLGATQSVQVGWCRVTAEGELGGLLVYQMLRGSIVESQATVLPSTRLRRFRLPLAYLRERTDMGMAIVNPMGGSTQIVMQYFAMDGTAATASSPFLLDSMNHVSRFVSQFLPGIADDAQGVVEVSSDTEMIAVGLAFINNYSEFTTIPVIPVP